MTASSSMRPGGPARVLALLLALSSTLRAGDFAGGTGTPEDPYQIATVEQLEQIATGNSGAGNYYVLIADIDYRGMGWGLGVSETYVGFEGVLDGDSHSIRNVGTELGTGACAVFGRLGGPGLIRDVTLENCRIAVTSSSAAAVLCGVNEGQILNCCVRNAVVSAQTNGDFGALAGVNRGLLRDCRAEDITLLGTGTSGGGLVGRNLGVVQRCGSEGSVFGFGYAGGLVGTNAGDVEACCARVAVAAPSGALCLGGLVGVNQGRIRNCYARGPVLAAGQSGGLVGYQEYGEITDCYSTAMLSAYSYWGVGPLVGTGRWGSIRHCYYLDLDPTDGDNGMGTPLDMGDMARRESYLDWEFFDDHPSYPWLLPEGGWPILVWEQQEEPSNVADLDVNDARRVLEQDGWQVGQTRWDYSRTVPAGHVITTLPADRALRRTSIELLASRGRFDWSAACAAPEAGTETHPLCIETAGQLEALADFPERHDKHFELVADIDMTGRPLSEPLLGETDAWNRHGAGGFSGRLEGHGFVIRNLAMRASPSILYAGLVACLAETGEVTNVGLTAATIAGSMGCGGQTAGAVVGFNQGLVQQCYVRGFICAEVAGGLVGQNRGTVNQCFSDTWTGTGCSGGLIGYNQGRLANSYTYGTAVGGNQECGTLIGSSYGRIDCCYATGLTVDENGQASPQMVGNAGNEQGADWYYRVGARYDSPLTIIHSVVGQPLLDPQMRQQVSFSGWDFWGTAVDGPNDVWLMPLGGYPLLMWQCGAENLAMVAEASGLTADEAVTRLHQAGINVETRYEYDSQVPPSQVVQVRVSSVSARGMTVDLTASLGPYDWAANPGDGSEAAPFALSHASQLFSLADHPELWDAHFVLTADLDLGWRTLDRALIAANTAPLDTNIVEIDPNAPPDPNAVPPDVDAVRPDFQGPRFNGVFDGAGHRLTNLTIAGGSSYLGLFGALGPDARVAHLHLDDVSIAGTAQTEHAGPIAGTSEGILEDCHTSGYVCGGANLGRFTGDGEYFITGCTSSVYCCLLPGGAPPRGRTR
jgi:hypothetical protein